MTLPNLPNVDPGDDPNGFVRELLARYFRPGLVDSAIRTWVPIGIGSALSWVNANYSVLGLPEKPSATAVIVATGLTIAGYYALARFVERKVPALGRWLIALNLTKAKPAYADPAAGPVVVAAVEEKRV